MGEYIIQPGDTLSKIAKMTGTTVKQLQEANGIKNANLIFAGNKLIIPDIESDNAFNIKGTFVEREVPEGKMRLMYGVPCNPGDKKGDIPGSAELPTKSGGSWWRDLIDGPTMRLMYGVPCNPGDNNIDIPDDKKGDIPGDKKGDIPGEPELPIKPGGSWWRDLIGGPTMRLMYGVPCNPEDVRDLEPGRGVIIRDDDYIDAGKDVVPGQEVKPGDDDVSNEVTLPEQEQEQVKLRATAKDMKLLDRLGVSKTSNDPNGRAQFVLGDEVGEVSITGENVKVPDTITIKDDTNGGFNKYTYRVITEKEIADGKTFDGIPLSKDQFKAGNGPYYVLIEAVDHEGSNLKLSHTEVFRLEYTERDDGSRSYDLIQDEGMDGSDRSSMDYRRR